MANEEEEKNRKLDRVRRRAEREKRVFVPKIQLCSNGLSERFKMAKKLRCEALAETTCEPEDKREEKGGGGGRGEEEEKEEEEQEKARVEKASSS